MTATTPSQPNRLDRIEKILELISANLDQTVRAAAVLGEAQQKIEQTLAEITASQQKTEQIVQSNARALQAEMTEARAHRQETRQMIRDLMARNFENLSQHQDFRDAIADFISRLDRMQGD